MEVLRCPNCNRSFVLIGADDQPDDLELTLFCVNCLITVQIAIPKVVHEEHPVGFHGDEGGGQYL